MYQDLVLSAKHEKLLCAIFAWLQSQLRDPSLCAIRS